jgi:hypothetical protein
MKMTAQTIDKQGKWLVYEGSIFSYHKRIHNECYAMEEAEWEGRLSRDGVGTAVVLQRGLTYEVAQTMLNLMRET